MMSEEFLINAAKKRREKNIHRTSLKDENVIHIQSFSPSASIIIHPHPAEMKFLESSSERSRYENYAKSFCIHTLLLVL